MNDRPVPPAWFGVRTWPIRRTERTKDGEQVERIVQTIYPPMMVGVPGEPTDEFMELQAYQGLVLRIEHPEMYCVDCGWRFSAHDGGRCGPCISRRQSEIRPLGGRGRRSG